MAMVRISGGTVALPPRTSATPAAASPPATPATVDQSSCAAVLNPSASSRVMVQELASMDTISTDETDLWKLWDMALEDAEATPRYAPTSIALDRVTPTRRWFVSHNAVIQDLLMQRPVLRRAVCTLRWLESTTTVPSEVLLGLPPDAPGADAHVARQVLWMIRSGDGVRAHDAAFGATAHILAATVAGAALRSVRESWHAHTHLVPLFTEYANSERPGKVIADNQRRLPLLAHLFTDAGTNDGEDAVFNAVSAALAGNYDALIAAFGGAQAGWKDTLWCRLRSTLIHVFSFAVMQFGHSVGNDESAKAFEAAVMRTCGVFGAGSTTNWIDLAEQQLTSQVAEIVRRASVDPSASTATALQAASLLSLVGPASCSSAPFSVPTTRNPRAVACLARVLDQAHHEGLMQEIGIVPQGTGNFLPILLAYAEKLAGGGVGHGGADFNRSRRAAVGFIATIQNADARAESYAGLAWHVRRHARSRHLNIEEQEHTLIMDISEAEARLHGASAAVASRVMFLLAEAIKSKLPSKEMPGSVVAGALPAHIPAKARAPDDVRSLMVTSHPSAEVVFLLSLPADGDMSGVFQLALDSCLALWTAAASESRQAQEVLVTAVGDIVSVVKKRVLPRLTDANAPPSGPQMKRFELWCALCTSFVLRDDHAAVVAGALAERTSAAPTGVRMMAADQTQPGTDPSSVADKTTFGASAARECDLRKKESDMRQSLAESVVACADRARAENYSAGIAAAVNFAECAALSMDFVEDAKAVMQTVFHCVQHVEHKGCLGDVVAGTAVSESLAGQLMTAVRTARLALGQRLRRDMVAAARAKAAEEMRAATTPGGAAMSAFASSSSHIIRK